MKKKSPNSRLGENIAREWNADPAASILWDALQLIKHDSVNGLKSLEEIARNGSGLAMMYIGDIYSIGKNNIHKDAYLAEYWLKKSSKISIEGSYQLAQHYLRSGLYDKYIDHLKNLACLKYSPAMFLLGYNYHIGKIVEKNNNNSLHYLLMAENIGHLHAINWIGSIYMKENYGIKYWFIGLFKKIKNILPMAKCIETYPHSDRLRT